MAATYATVAEVAGAQGYLSQLDVTDPDVKAKLEAILERAEGIVDGVLGFHFEDYTTATVQTAFAGRGSYFTLPAHEQGSVTAVTDLYDNAQEDYREIEDGSLLFTDQYGYLGNWRGVQWKVTANWGYGPVPADVKEVMLEIAVNIWQSAESGRFTNVVGVTGGGAVGYESALTPTQSMTLKNAIRRVTPQAI